MKVYLVTDQVPLLLTVVLAEDLDLVWRKIHRVLAAEIHEINVKKSNLSIGSNNLQNFFTLFTFYVEVSQRKSEIQTLLMVHLCTSTYVECDM